MKRVIGPYISAQNPLKIDDRSHCVGVVLTMLLCALAGCSSTSRSWDGQVDQWGTMKEVLAEGKSEKRVSLAPTRNQHQLVGVGALEGLAGEVTIYQGKTWISKDETRAVEATDQSATLLVTSRVTKWNKMHYESAIAADQLERVIRDAAEQSGLDISKPFPFVIEGRLNVDAHVIRGACPHAGSATVPRPPITLSIKDEPGTLVGFYAGGNEGNLTHGGTEIHAHVLTKETPPRTGHVDSASMGAGSTIRLPSRNP